jgi:hypothetical protein
MPNFVPMGQHFISVYFDHDESIERMVWDDVIDFSIAKLPPVSPAKTHIEDS